jgi:hypothetical protein
MLRPPFLGLALAAWGLGQAPAQPPRLIPDDGTPDNPTEPRARSGTDAAPQPRTPTEGSTDSDPHRLDITRPYAVFPQAGAWMICAASYTGPTAPTLAVQLAEQIRTKHHMPAYIFNRADEERRRMMTTRMEDEERAARLAAEQGWVLPRRHWSIRIEEQCAVLIGGTNGGWSDMDDAGSFQKKVRKWPLPELHLDNGLDPYDHALGVKREEIADHGLTITNTPKRREQLEVLANNRINPFTTSFVIRNPSLPHDNKPVNRYDPAWEKFNAYEDYSLLKCPKPWTLAIKEYLGNRVVQPQAESSGFLEKIGLGGSRVGSSLSAAGTSAHELAHFLRQLGFPAYVLHTRNSSIVTVGAFESMKDPDMERTADRLARFSFKRKDTGAGYDLGLFPKPIPMEVPHP